MENRDDSPDLRDDSPFPEFDFSLADTDPPSALAGYPGAPPESSRFPDPSNDQRAVADPENVQFRLRINETPELHDFTRTGCEYPPDQVPALIATVSSDPGVLYNITCLATVRLDQLRDCPCVRESYYPEHRDVECLEVRGPVVDEALKRFATYARSGLHAHKNWTDTLAINVRLRGLCMNAAAADRIRTDQVLPASRRGAMPDDDGFWDVRLIDVQPAAIASPTAR